MDADRLTLLFDMTGGVVIFTGGTPGIGRALAEGHLATGAAVAIASRRPDAWTAPAEHLRSMCGDVIAVPTRTGEVHDIMPLVSDTATAFGRIDVLVNDAATVR